MTMQIVDSASGAVWPSGIANEHGGSGPVFHVASGLYFCRKPDGGVIVRHYKTATVGEEPDFEIDCTPEAWASAVSAMQAGGETYGSWSAAVARQRGTT